MLVVGACQLTFHAQSIMLLHGGCGETSNAHLGDIMGAGGNKLKSIFVICVYYIITRFAYLE